MHIKLCTSSLQSAQRTDSLHTYAQPSKNVAQQLAYVQLYFPRTLHDEITTLSNACVVHASQWYQIIRDIAKRIFLTQEAAALNQNMLFLQYIPLQSHFTSVTSQGYTYEWTFFNSMTSSRKSKISSCVCSSNQPIRQVDILLVFSLRWQFKTSLLYLFSR